MKEKMGNKISINIIILLLLAINVLSPQIYGKTESTGNLQDLNELQYIKSIINESLLDLEYIYSITENLSYIIFTEYNESAGEIAKGREFGTKGEWRAAEILYENMTKLGLNTTMEKIENIPNVPGCSKLTYKTEVLDYKLIITNKTSNYSETVDCSPSASKFGPRSKPFKKDHNFSYTGLKVRREHPSLLEDKEDYVLISGISYPKEINGTENITCDGLKFYINGLKDSLSQFLKDYLLHPHFKGYLSYDITNDTHDQGGSKCAPQFSINGSIGRMINSSVEDYIVDFYLNQQLNKSVTSYNVIGQLNGTHSSKTVIIDCLYDGWWNQATADSAIGMGIVMGIAKYFADHSSIKPYYNVKFIAFGGEEYGMRGARYYEATHRDEKIIYVVDLNQLGFTQEEKFRLKLEIVTNKKKFTDEVWKIVERTDYINRTGNTADIKPFTQLIGHISDDRVFATKRPFSCKTVCF